MKPPEDVQLSREEGEALIERIERNALSTEDRRVLGKILPFYFWLLFALREAKLGLKRRKALVFGEKPKPPSSGGTPSGGSGGGSELPTNTAQGVLSTITASLPEKKPPPPGHGRHGTEVYRAAQTVACHHEELAVGERGPACGRGRLYRLPPGVEMGRAGNAVLAAVRYALERLRCSACGQIFTAAMPAVTGTEQYTARARAVLARARYYLGLPWHRLEGVQALVGVPVPDATQGEQSEIVGDCTYPLFKGLEKEAAQGEVIFQDERLGRVLALSAENQQAQAQARAQGKAKPPERTGMQTTALIVQVGARQICLYYTGRGHAGENLERLFAQREPGRDPPWVRADALSSNQADEAGLSRCHCLAHGRRQFRVLDEAFPPESAIVVNVLKGVSEHDDEARPKQLSAPERWVSHQTYSEPVLTTLKTWVEEQPAQR